MLAMTSTSSPYTREEIEVISPLSTVDALGFLFRKLIFFFQNMFKEQILVYFPFPIQEINFSVSQYINSSPPPTPNLANL